MTIRNFVSDLITDLRDNFDASNVTGYSTRPIIISSKRRISSDTNGDSDAGILIIDKASMALPRDVAMNYEERPYTALAEFSMHGQSSATAFENTISEIRRVIDVLNATAGRTYFLDMLIIDYPNNDINPKCRLEFHGLQEFISI